MNKLTVFYDGSCIACDTEINHYKKIDRLGLLEIVDITSPTFSVEEYKLDSKLVNESMHTVDANGNVYRGVDSFIQIWARIPSYHFFKSVAQIKPLRPFFDLCYKGFARHIRPRLPKKSLSKKSMQRRQSFLNNHSIL